MVCCTYYMNPSRITSDCCSRGKHEARALRLRSPHSSRSIYKVKEVNRAKPSLTRPRRRKGGLVHWSVAQGLRDHFPVFNFGTDVAADLGRVSSDEGLRHLFRFHPSAGMSEDLLCERGAQSESEGRRATCCARSSPLPSYGASWCVISVSLSHGFIVPDLTRTEHRVHSTSEAPSGSDPSDLPAETLPDQFVGLR